MGKKKKTNKSTERHAFGLTILKAAHKDMRRLKKDHEPEIHGNKFWASSYLVMDYLRQQKMAKKTRVMEVGCGWGLLGMFCAKEFGAKVTGVDADPNVFPYLNLHAETNGVALKTKEGRFENLKKKDLAKQNLVLGADICFWDELIDPLFKMTKKALSAGVEQVIIADPGRPPFDKLCQRCEALGGQTKEWEIETPVRAHGWLLIVGSLPTAKRA